MHQAILTVFQPKGFQDVVFYSVSQSYTLFITTSFVVLISNAVLIQKKQEQIGYIFLVISTVKAAVVLGFLMPTFTTIDKYIDFERGQYLFLFVAFLALDVYQTAVFLRNNSPKRKNTIN